MTRTPIRRFRSLTRRISAARLGAEVVAQRAHDEGPFRTASDRGMSLDVGRGRRVPLRWPGAEVAEPADAAVLNTADRKVVRVRTSPSAPPSHARCRAGAERD